MLADVETSSVQVQTAVPSSGGGASLTSQLMEAHNLLQQQGGGTPAVESMGGPPADIPSLPLSGITTAQGLNISPELLAQVSSLLNLPTVPVPSSAPSLGGDSAPLLSPQGNIVTLMAQYVIMASVHSHTFSLWPQYIVTHFSLWPQYIVTHLAYGLST